MNIIFRVLGYLLLVESVFMLSALVVSLIYREDCWKPLLVSALITSFLGGLSVFLTGRKPRSAQVSKREGYIIVTSSWIAISLFGSLPFILCGYIPSFTNAFFETISGFTTTGATILTDIESFPKGLLFWRSLTHWIGGMGIIVFTLAILPFLGIGGMQLFAAEVPGPAPDKLHPRITGTAKRLWGIYVIFTFLETILLMFGGMDLFDALCHAFATMATGGFSTRNESIAAFSPYIQYVIIVFMFLAGVNFTLHYYLLHRKFRKIGENQEFKYYSALILVATVFIGLGLVISQNIGVEKAFRDSLFQVVSIVTTTGFISSDYLLWPTFAWIVIFLLMFTGGSAGSTGGGMKALRQVILFKNVFLELKRLIHPNAIMPVRYNGRTIPEDISKNILVFVLIYMLIFVGGVFVMSLMGMDFETAMGSVIASLGNIGPGIGSVGPVDNYAAIPDVGKWFLSFLMLCGRLELFTVLILLSPSFWKK